ncbi:MAG TPA: DivIVA domain-containing protein [Pseudonocardiaceae bacterium]|nr:DivIVA domain-containing protein [Pseudonocardiaceae bacterium]
MPLLPDEVAAKTFRRRWGRGYDRHQVEAFLRAVASDYGGAISRVAALAEERTRALADNGRLRSEMEALTQSVREAADSARAEAERDAEAIHRRAEQAAAAIIRQAEDGAAALTRHAESLRSAAQSDADTARRRVEDTERWARQNEDATRQRCDALQVEIEQRWQHLRAAERRMDQCIQQADRALGALRARAVLLDQVDEVEKLIATIRADVQEVCSQPQTFVNGDEPTLS